MKDVDGEVLQNLKRLGRKDPTTKVRLLVIFLLQAFIFFPQYIVLYVIRKKRKRKKKSIVCHIPLIGSAPLNILYSTTCAENI
jgi:hypothetical protein